MKLKVLCMGWLLLHLAVRAAAISVDSTWLALDAHAVHRLVRVAAAHRVDSTASFRRDWNTYCRVMMEQRFAVLHHAAEEDSSTTSAKELRLRCCHLFYPVPQTASHAQLLRGQEGVARLRQSLVAGDCSVLQDRQDGKFRYDTCWMMPHRQPEVLEQALDTLKPGVWSEPILTPMGIHLLYVLCKEVTLPTAKRRLTDHELAQLKEKHQLKMQQDVVERLRKGKEPEEGILFYLDGRPYTLATYRLFTNSCRISPRRGFDAFLQKSLADAEAMALLADGGQHARSMAARDSLLVHHLLLREVDPQLQDEEVLQAWFQEHLAEFKQPVFRGLVLHCIDKQQGRALRKFLKRLPESERQKALRQVFATQPEEAPVVEEGVFVAGSNPYVDAALFGGSPVNPYPARPYLQLVGRKSKGPVHYDEVRQEVKHRYRLALIQQLLRDEAGEDNVEN